MNVLHICHAESVRFVGQDGYYQKFQRALSDYNHYFYIMDDGLKTELEDLTDSVCFKSNDLSNSKLDDWLFKADYVVLHSMHSEDIKHLKILLKKINEKKIIWLIWGHDLYDAYYDARHIKGLRVGYLKHYVMSKISEHYRKKIIKSFYSIVGEMRDVNQVKALYQTNAKMIDYDFIGYGTPKPIECKIKENAHKKVFVGNHLDPHCRYEDSFRRIAKYDDGKLEVYCVACGYTDENKTNKKTIDVGRKLFGNRLHLITEFTQYDDYCALLSTMDVAIFNIDRQMAQGTALIFLYYGKKVFFSTENGNYDEYSKLGIKVFHLDELSQKEIFNSLTKQEVDQNRMILTRLLSDERFAEIWKSILK